jgi:hypothetical protein
MFSRFLTPFPPLTLQLCHVEHLLRDGSRTVRQGHECGREPGLPGTRLGDVGLSLDVTVSASMAPPAFAGVTTGNLPLSHWMTAAALLRSEGVNRPAPARNTVETASSVSLDVGQS